MGVTTTITRSTRVTRREARGSFCGPCRGSRRYASVVGNGHPYDTEELAAQRAAQRRLLRSVPDWLLRENRYRITETTYRFPDAAYVETLVRREAQPIIDSLAKLTAGWTYNTNTMRLWEFLSLEADKDPGAGLAPALQNLQIQLGERGRKINQSATLDEKYQTPVLLLIYLLCLADQLADDGYRDPRL